MVLHGARSIALYLRERTRGRIECVELLACGWMRVQCTVNGLPENLNSHSQNKRRAGIITSKNIANNQDDEVLRELDRMCTRHVAAILLQSAPSRAGLTY